MWSALRVTKSSLLSADLRCTSHGNSLSLIVWRNSGWGCRSVAPMASCKSSSFRFERWVHFKSYLNPRPVFSFENPVLGGISGSRPLAVMAAFEFSLGDVSGESHFPGLGRRCKFGITKILPSRLNSTWVHLRPPGGRVVKVFHVEWPPKPYLLL